MKLRYGTDNLVSRDESGVTSQVTKANVGEWGWCRDSTPPPGWFSP